MVFDFGGYIDARISYYRIGRTEKEAQK